MSGIAWFVGNILPYITWSIFFIALLYNFLKWFFIPRPIVWAIFPARYNTLSIYANIVKRIFTLPGPLFVDKVIFVLALLFHFGLIISLSLHAKYIFTPNLPIEYLLGTAAGIAAAIGSFGFVIRRMTLKEKAVSTPEDYFSLILLILTLSLGCYLRILNLVDHEAMWSWVIGVLTLRPVDPPANPIFIVHILLAQIYIAYLPFKTLMHPIGIFFGQKVILDGRHIHKTKEGDQA